MILICNLRSDVLSVTLVKFNKYVMERIAIFPGSFDPFTIGHEEIVKRGLKMFDKIVIAVGINAVKKEFLDVDTRIAIIRKVFEDVDNVIVLKHEKNGLNIYNGALEYEEKNINILKDVADTLDGGVEVIRKRWKRYDKNDNA